jgi:hypothetical protein
MPDLYLLRGALMVKQFNPFTDERDRSLKETLIDVVQ